MQFLGVEALIKKYQTRAAAEGVDALGYYMAPWGYAQLQLLEQGLLRLRRMPMRRLLRQGCRMPKARRHGQAVRDKGRASGACSAGRHRASEIKRIASLPAQQNPTQKDRPHCPPRTSA
jgi:hypothetical protein